MFKKIYFFIIILLSGIYCFAIDLHKIPILTSPVMDTAHLMNHNNAQILNNALLDYYNTTGTQIVILTVNDIYSDSIFDYSVRVMDTWKIGRKNIDDGVLILIVKNIRKVNISVGRGLEGVIPDAYAKRIIEQTMVPAFKIGDLDTGIINAVQQIQKLIADEKLPSMQQHTKQGKNSFIKYFFMFLFVLPWIFNLIFGKTIGSILFATLAVIFSFSVGVSIFFCVLIGIGFFCFGYFFDKTNVMMTAFNNNDRWFGGGFGGKGGGGGFSGGGGGFGGGGASGGW